MDYAKPQEIVKGMLATGQMKLDLPVHQLVMRGALAGAFLAVATSMAVVAAVETGLWIVGSLLFPIWAVSGNLAGDGIDYREFRALALRHGGGKGKCRSQPGAGELGLGLCGQSPRQRLLCRPAGHRAHDGRNRGSLGCGDQAD
jgi:hypothetical protein